MPNPPTSTPTSLTVAVCTFNRAALLARMLESIRRQTRNDFDILVLDDCSSDGTRALCEPLVGDRFRYVRNATNIGFNANYNQALTLATTSHVLLTHDDDFMDPGFVAYLFEGVARYPESILVTTNVRLVRDVAPLMAGSPPIPPAQSGQVGDTTALKMVEDVVFENGEYSEAYYWKGLGLYCPTFCFHRRRCLEAGIAFDPVGPGSDILISLRANLAGPIAVLAEAHFNVCTHLGQDHGSPVNELTSAYRLERAAVPMVCREPVFASVRDTALFSLTYHFAKAATAALVDLPGIIPAANNNTVEARYARHLASLPPELRATVFASGRNRVAARLFGQEQTLADVPRRDAADWVRRIPELSTHQRKWHLANFAMLDRLEDLLSADGRLERARDRFLSNRNILIWGFSYLGILLAETLLRLRAPLVGFVDRNPQLHGARYRGLECRSWSAALESLPSNDREILVLTGVEGSVDVDLALEMLPDDPTKQRTTFRSWRTAIDLLEAATAEIPHHA